MFLRQDRVRRIHGRAVPVFASLVTIAAVWTAPHDGVFPVGSPASAGGLTVVTATYGRNCGKRGGNVTSHIARACNGKASCSYRVDHRVIGDPAPGCAKDYRVLWRCPGRRAPRSAALGREASGRSLTLSCGRAAVVRRRQRFSPVRRRRQVAVRPGRPRAGAGGKARAPLSRPVARPVRRGAAAATAPRKTMSAALSRAVSRMGKSLRGGGAGVAVTQTAVGKIAGLGSLVPIDEIHKAYKEDVLKGKALPGEKAPTALAKSEAEAYRKLLPDLHRYVVYMAETAFRARDLDPKAYQRSDVVESLANYGCRQIDRALPGFARVVKVKIAVDLEEGDEPDSPIADEKLLKLKCADATFAQSNPKACRLDGPKPPAEPKERPKPIEVEVCTVTHRQLAATLTADVGRIVAVVKPGSAPLTDRLEPIVPVSVKSPGGGGTAGEIPESDARLLENDYEFVTRRLTGFYRWSGANRNFSRAMKRSGGEIKKLVSQGETKGPKALKTDISEHKASVPARNARELLRRSVYQWTDAYEYLQMAGFIARGATYKGRPIRAKYLPREKEVLGAFWIDCTEISVICQEPISAGERKHCQACAEKAVEKQCIAGREGSSCKGQTQAKLSEEAKKVGLAASAGAYTTGNGKFSSGNTFLNWLALQVVEEASNAKLHRGSNAQPAGLRRNIPRWVALTKFLGTKPSDAEMTNEGKKYLDALPVTSWQRCFLWRSKADFDKGICDLHEEPKTSSAPKTEACKEGSYDRGIGTIPGGCPAGFEKQGLLCYPKCKAGYEGRLNYCWKRCPSGYHNDPVTCRKDTHIFGKERRHRGIGLLPRRGSCGGGRELHQGLCYARCPSGYRGIGPVCWQGCPGGYRDDGLTCRKDAHITGANNRGCPWYDKCGVGAYYWKHKRRCSTCPAGYKNDGCTCRRDAHIFGKKSRGRGIGTIPPMACSPDRELHAGLCYKRCPAGFKGVGVDCYKAGCPAGYKDDGLTCRRDVHIFGRHAYGRETRGASCGGGRENSVGLCYKKCRPGFYGVMTRCTKKCPPPPLPPAVVTLKKTFEANAFPSVPLFRMALSHPGVTAFFASVGSVANKARDDCKGRCNQTKKSQDLLKERYDKLIHGVTRDLQASSDHEMGEAGEGAGSVLTNILGKILGLLLNAAGMSEMMKTLAKAAGLTPEQSADCEDPEYRHETMKLTGSQDTKRGCLLKVFAKNFASVLESIIIMLGNKLVDWAVNLLRTALQGAKSALLASAGSVPFAGGFLATLVDIAWELIFNFGVKTLLNTLIIANLPEWLQVRRLARIPYEELVKHPVVAVILGILVELIDSAVQSGKQNFLAMGFDVVLSTIQQVLAAKKQYFWVRAIAFAKKQMAQQGPKQGLLEQIMALVQGLVGGFGEAVERGLEPQFRPKFKRAVERIQGFLEPSRFKELGAMLKQNPVNFIVNEVLAKTLGPVVIPIITSFVKMPGWTKRMLERLANRIDEIPELVRGKKVTDLVRIFVEVAEPALRQGLEAIPFGSESLKKLVLGAFDGIVSAVSNLDRIKTDFLDKPWVLLAKAVELARDFLVSKVKTAFAGIGSAGEGDLLSRAIGVVLDLVTDKGGLRQRIFGGGINRAELIGLVADVVGPYVRAKFKQLAEGTGFSAIVKLLLDAFLGPENAPVKGAAFLSGLSARLSAAGARIATEAKAALTGLMAAEATITKGGVLGKMLGSLVGPVIGAVKQAGGVQALVSGQPFAVVKKLAGVIGAALLSRSQDIGGSRRAVLGTLKQAILSFAGDPERVGTNAQGLLGKAVDWAVGALRNVVSDSIAYVPLRALILGLVDGLAELLKAPRDLLGAFRDRQAAIRLLLPKVTRPFRSFLKSALVTPVAGAAIPGGNIAAGLLEGLIDGAVDLVEKPAELERLIAQIKSGNLKELLKRVVGGLVSKLVSASGWKGTIRDVVEKAAGPMIEWLTGTLMK